MVCPVFSYKTGTLFSDEYAVLTGMADAGVHVDLQCQLVFDPKSKAETLLEISTFIYDVSSLPYYFNLLSTSYVRKTQLNWRLNPRMAVMPVPRSTRCGSWRRTAMPRRSRSGCGKVQACARFVAIWVKHPKFLSRTDWVFSLTLIDLFSIGP